MNVMHYNTRGFLSQAQARKLTGLTTSTINKLEKEGRFPASIEITPHIRVWDCMEVFVWMENKKSDRNWREELVWGPLLRPARYPNRSWTSRTRRRHANRAGRKGAV